MGYTRDYLNKPQMRERPWKVHPIWRGIGCILIILIPIMSYAAAVMLVDANITAGWVPAPAVYMQTVLVPYLDMPIAHLYANLMVAGVLMLVGYAGLMVFYSVMYSVVGPPRLGPQDAPPIHRKRKQKYKTRS